MSEDSIDPRDSRPEGHYPWFVDNEWQYIPKELAQTISLGPTSDGEESQDWVLTYTAEKRDESDREKVLVRLTLRALHELYIETKRLSADDRMHGHNAEHDLYDEQINLDQAIPKPRGEPSHKHCWAEYTGAPE